MNKCKLVFRITTALLILMYLGGASRYFLAFQETSNVFAALDFPRWLHPVLGILKFLAVGSLMTILFDIKTAPKWLKEWTYAGIFFNLILAILAHPLAGDPMATVIPPVVALIMVIISRVSWGKLNDS